MAVLLAPAPIMEERAAALIHPRPLLIPVLILLAVLLPLSLPVLLPAVLLCLRSVEAEVAAMVMFSDGIGVGGAASARRNVIVTESAPAVPP